jgi:hypothetical protein
MLTGIHTLKLSFNLIPLGMYTHISYVYVWCAYMYLDDGSQTLIPICMFIHHDVAYMYPEPNEKNSILN